MLGTVTPFCSCSSIPIFIGFACTGLPLGVIILFLISSPLVELGILVLLMSIFGAKVAMPAIAINEKVVSVGKVLKTTDEIKLLKKLDYC